MRVLLKAFPWRRRKRGRSSEEPSNASGDGPSPWTVWIIGVPMLAGALGLMHYADLGPFAELRSSIEDEVLLEAAIVDLERENAQLQQEIKDLGQGGFGVERRAREQLGWSRAGEIIIRLPEKR